MSKICPVCGMSLTDDAVFCSKCGTDVSGAGTTEELKVGETIFMDRNGKYRWIYELPMLKSFFLLLQVWKVIAMASCIVLIFMALLNLIERNGLDVMLGMAGMIALTLGILLVLSFPAYYIVTKANNGKYTVLFEMDEDGIDHTQIKTDKAEALDLLTTFVGMAAGSRSTTAAGLLSASGGSLYSRFANVKRIKGDRKHNLIYVNGTLIHNMVYADANDYDFVYDYIVRHCPNARVS